MQLKFTITTSSGSKELIFGNNPLQTLENFPYATSLDDNFERFAGTNFYKNTNSFFNRAVRLFSGRILGDSSLAAGTARRNDFENRLHEFRSLLNNEFEFRLVNNYKLPDGTDSTFKEYTFSGKIVEAKLDDFFSDHARYTLQIACESPYIQDSTEIMQRVNIEQLGFYFPVYFPFQFSGTNSTITINNTSGVELFPNLDINGSGTNFKIASNLGTGRQLEINTTISSNEKINITPQPNDPIKIRKAGVSIYSFTNFEFDIFRVPPYSEVEFRFSVDSNNDANTSAEMRYRLNYLSY